MTRQIRRRLGGRLSAFLGLLVSGALAGAQAGVLLEDDFAYADGSLTNVSNGKWILHSGNGAGILVSNSVLELDSTSTDRTDDAHCPLAGGPVTRASGAVLYAAFSFKLTALPAKAGGYFAHLKDAGTGFRARVFATTNDATAGQYRLGIANGASTPGEAVLTNDLSLETTHRVVIRYAVAAAAATLWVDPAAEADPSVTGADNSAPVDISAFAFRQSLSSGAGAGKASVDDLIVATSFAAVLPGAAAPPLVAVQPQSQNVAAGATVSFSVTATGAGPLAYQWQFAGRPIPGETNATLTLQNVTAAQAGEYRVSVANGGGAVTSEAATLTVEAPSPIGRVSIAKEASGAMVLSWRVETGRSCTLWCADQVTGPFTTLAENLTAGQYVDDAARALEARFYRLSAP